MMIYRLFDPGRPQGGGEGGECYVHPHRCTKVSQIPILPSMPARFAASPDQIQKYKSMRLEGRTQKDAAESLGLSASWGKKMDRELQLRNQIKEERFRNPDAELRPLRPHELSPIAKDCLEDFGRWRARYLGRISSPWQEQAAYVVNEHYATPYKEFGVVNAPPGSGKSTLFTHDIPGWQTCRSRSIRGMIGSSTQKMADNYTGRLRNTFARRIPMEAKSEDLALGLAVDAQATLMADYGLFRPDPALGAPWSRSSFTVAQLGEISTDEKEATWTAFGKDAGFLGFRIREAIWDDLFRRQDMLGIDRITKLQNFFDWYDDEVETRLEPGGLLILQGQRLGAEDIYHYALNKRTYVDDDDYELFELGEEQQPTERKYFHVVFKAHYEELCDAAVDRYVHSRKAPPYDPNNPKNERGHAPCLLEPVRLPWRDLKTLMNRPSSNFKVVYQQEDVDPQDTLVPAFFIDGGTYEGVEYEGCWDLDRDPSTRPPILDKIDNRSQVLSIITADPSPTKYWAVQWWVYIQQPNQERLMGQRFLIDQVFKPMGANNLLDYDTNTHEWEGLLVDWSDRARQLRIPIDYLILEVNAAQKFMKQYKFFKTWLKDQSIKLKPHHTHINKLDDKMGVTTIRSQYEYGRVRLPGTKQGQFVSEDLYLQVTRYPDAVYDDCVMAHWFLEYQLQHLVKRARRGIQIYKDIPSWINREPSYA